MSPLSGIRTLLEARAEEVEEAHLGLEYEKARLTEEFQAKVNELSLAKERLEEQVFRLEEKEESLRREWARFESEKVSAVKEAEAHLASLARVLAAGIGVDLRLEPVAGISTPTAKDTPTFLSSSISPPGSPNADTVRAALNFSPAAPVTVTPSKTEVADGLLMVESELFALADQLVVEAGSDDDNISSTPLAMAGPVIPTFSTPGLTNAQVSFDSLAPLSGTLSTPSRGSAPSSASKRSRGPDMDVQYDTLKAVSTPGSSIKRQKSMFDILASPPIKEKLQASKLKATLQMLAKRTSILHTAASAVSIREVNVLRKERDLELQEQELAKTKRELESTSLQLMAIKSLVGASGSSANDNTALSPLASIEQQYQSYSELAARFGWNLEADANTFSNAESPSPSAHLPDAGSLANDVITKTRQHFMQLHILRGFALLEQKNKDWEVLRNGQEEAVRAKEDTLQAFEAQLSSLHAELQQQQQLLDQRTTDFEAEMTQLKAEWTEQQRQTSESMLEQTRHESEAMRAQLEKETRAEVDSLRQRLISEMNSLREELQSNHAQKIASLEDEYKLFVSKLEQRKNSEEEALVSELEELRAQKLQDLETELRSVLLQKEKKHAELVSEWEKSLDQLKESTTSRISATAEAEKTSLLNDTRMECNVILERARREADSLKAAAEDEATSQRNKLQRELRLLEEEMQLSRDEAKSVLAKAEREAESILSVAKEESEELLKKTQRQIDLRTRQAAEDISEMRSIAEAERKSLLVKARVEAEEIVSSARMEVQLMKRDTTELEQDIMNRMSAIDVKSKELESLRTKLDEQRLELEAEKTLVEARKLDIERTQKSFMEKMESIQRETEEMCAARLREAERRAEEMSTRCAQQEEKELQQEDSKERVVALEAALMQLEQEKDALVSELDHMKDQMHSWEAERARRVEELNEREIALQRGQERSSYSLDMEADCMEDTTSGTAEFTPHSPSSLTLSSHSITPHSASGQAHENTSPVRKPPRQSTWINTPEAVEAWEHRLEEKEEELRLLESQLYNWEKSLGSVHSAIGQSLRPLRNRDTQALLSPGLYGQGAPDNLDGGNALPPISEAPLSSQAFDGSEEGVSGLLDGDSILNRSGIVSSLTRTGFLTNSPQRASLGFSNNFSNTQGEDALLAGEQVLANAEELSSEIKKWINQLAVQQEEFDQRVQAKEKQLAEEQARLQQLKEQHESSIASHGSSLHRESLHASSPTKSVANIFDAAGGALPLSERLHTLSDEQKQEADVYLVQKAALEFECMELVEKSHKLNEEVTSLQRKLKVMQEEIDGHQQNLSMNAHELEASKVQVEETKTELLSVQTELNIYEEKLKSAQDLWDTTEKRMNVLFEEQKATQAALEAQQQDLAHREEQLSISMQALRDETTALEAERNRLLQEREQLQVEQVSIANERMTLDEFKLYLEEQRKEVGEWRDAFEADKSQWKAEMEKDRSAMESERNAIEEEHKSIQSLLESVASHEARLDIRRAELDALEADLAVQHEEVQEQLQLIEKNKLALTDRVTKVTQEAQERENKLREWEESLKARELALEHVSSPVGKSSDALSPIRGTIAACSPQEMEDLWRALVMEREILTSTRAALDKEREEIERIWQTLQSLPANDVSHLLSLESAHLASPSQQNGLEAPVFLSPPPSQASQVHSSPFAASPLPPRSPIPPAWSQSIEKQGAFSPDVLLATTSRSQSPNVSHLRGENDVFSTPPFDSKMSGGRSMLFTSPEEAFHDSQFTSAEQNEEQLGIPNSDTVISTMDANDDPFASHVEPTQRSSEFDHVIEAVYISQFQQQATVDDYNDVYSSEEEGTTNQDTQMNMSTPRAASVASARAMSLEDYYNQSDSSSPEAEVDEKRDERMQELHRQETQGHSATSPHSSYQTPSKGGEEHDSEDEILTLTPTPPRSPRVPSSSAEFDFHAGASEGMLFTPAFLSSLSSEEAQEHLQGHYSTESQGDSDHGNAESTIDEDDSALDTNMLAPPSRSVTPPHLSRTAVPDHIKCSLCLFYVPSAYVGRHAELCRFKSKKAGVVPSSLLATSSPSNLVAKRSASKKIARALHRTPWNRHAAQNNDSQIALRSETPPGALRKYLWPEEAVQALENEIGEASDVLDAAAQEMKAQKRRSSTLQMLATPQRWLRRSSVADSPKLSSGAQTPDVAPSKERTLSSASLAGNSDQSYPSTPIAAIDSGAFRPEEEDTIERSISVSSLGDFLSQSGEQSLHGAVATPSATSTPNAARSRTPSALKKAVQMPGSAIRGIGKLVTRTPKSDPSAFPPRTPMTPTAVPGEVSFGENKGAVPARRASKLLTPFSKFRQSSTSKSVENTPVRTGAMWTGSNIDANTSVDLFDVDATPTSHGSLETFLTTQPANVSQIYSYDLPIESSSLPPLHSSTPSSSTQYRDEYRPADLPPSTPAEEATAMHTPFSSDMMTPTSPPAFDTSPDTSFASPVHTAVASAWESPREINIASPSLLSPPPAVNDRATSPESLAASYFMPALPRAVSRTGSRSNSRSSSRSLTPKAESSFGQSDLLHIREQLMQSQRPDGAKSSRSNSYSTDDPFGEVYR